MADASSEVPFGGGLSSALEEAIRAGAAEQLASGLDPAKILELVDSLPYEALIDQVSEHLYDTLKAGRAPLLEDLDEGQRGVQTALVDVWGEADAIFRAYIYGSWELGAAISRASQQHRAHIFALLGVHGRAVRVASEVRHLAMSGFHSGAVARHRSLQEIATVALILSGSPEEIARRYLEYSHIERLGDMRAYQAHAQALGRKAFDDVEVRAAEEAADQAVKQWGAAMRKPNGWAQPLLPDKNRIAIADLEQLADLQHLRPFYRLGNHFVHAGPRASVLNTREEPGVEGRRLIMAGPTVMADIAETCHGAMISLHHATTALGTAYLTSEPKGPVETVVTLKALSMFVRDAGPAYGASAERARDLGWFNHGPDD